MKLDFYKPKNKLLANYIEGYYFIAEDRNAGPIKYLTFPNNFCILTVNQNIDVGIKDNIVTIRSSDNENMMTCLVSRYTAPIHICYEHLINEVTIYFKPLGINHFLTDTKEAFSHSTVLNFVFQPDFNSKMTTIFGLDRNHQIQELEDYLLSKLQIKDFALIEQLLLTLDTDKKIEEIARKHSISRQYLNKIFTKHIGKSPSEYRKISRFRNAIIKQKDSRNFTELSQYDFYDQSHFIRNFKELTHNNPHLFFKNVDTKRENIWLFI